MFFRAYDRLSFCFYFAFLCCDSMDREAQLETWYTMYKYLEIINSKLLPGSYIKHAGPGHLLQKGDLDETNPPVQYLLPSLPPPDAHSTYPIVYVSDRRQPS